MVFSSQRKVKIDKDLYDRLEGVALQQGYSSTDEFIRHVLEREARADIDPTDQQEAERQLRGLGYID